MYVNLTVQQITHESLQLREIEKRNPFCEGLRIGVLLALDRICDFHKYFLCYSV